MKALVQVAAIAGFALAAGSAAAQNVSDAPLDSGRAQAAPSPAMEEGERAGHRGSKRSGAE